MILANLTATELDPILQLAIACQQDPRDHKVDLGIGVYKDDVGRTPIMAAVKAAEAQVIAAQQTKVYQGMPGLASYNQAMSQLLLGQDTKAYDRSAAVQTPGASGALKLIADTIKQSTPDAKVWLSNPSYANHAPIMRAAGLQVAHYPYFNPGTGLVDQDAMLECLSLLGPKDVVLLHGACHNPTGADIDFACWQSITQLVLERGFLPFVDMAYQGFGQGLEEDAAGLRFLAERVPFLLVASSCSKNFGLYAERVGLALAMAPTLLQSRAIVSRFLESARSTYTMPPNHGAAIVAQILTSPDLRQQWQQELEAMRLRVLGLRQGLVQALAAADCSRDLSFINRHQGMFSVLSLTDDQCDQLREEHAIYLVKGGRLNMAALNSQQLDYVAQAFAEVL